MQFQRTQGCSTQREKFACTEALEPEQPLPCVVAEVRRLQRVIGKRIELDVCAADALWGATHRDASFSGHDTDI